MDVITQHRLRMLSLGQDDLLPLNEAERADCIYRAFLARVPYENLSNNMAVQEAPNEPDAWPRATDRLLRENATLGLGGTSFSLAYALRDLLRGAGLTAHVTLGYNLVTEQAHAAVVSYAQGVPHLYDPSLLLKGAVPVRPGGTLDDPLGRFVLEPRSGPTLTLTLRLIDPLRIDVPGCPNEPDAAWAGAAAPGEVRAVYSILPVPAPPHSFRQAWLASFYRGRARPLRLARRSEDVIYRYGERPHTLEVLRACGREEVPLGPDPAETLAEVFCIDPGCLRAWFRGRGIENP